MSGNPFETSLKTLHEAAAIGQINAEVVRLLEQPKRQFEFTIPVRMDDGNFSGFPGPLLRRPGAGQKRRSSRSRYGHGYRQGAWLLDDH